MALKAVSEKGAISVLIFNRILMNFQTPRGGGRGVQMAFKIDPRALVFAKRFCLECTTAAVVHSKQNDQEAGRAWNA